MLFSALLAGCSSNVKLSCQNVSNVDSNVNIDNLPLLLLMSSEEVIAHNKRLHPDVIVHLKERGFTNVSKYRAPQIIVSVVNFTSETKTETKQTLLFSNNRAKPTFLITICRTKCRLRTLEPASHSLSTLYGTHC